MLSQSLRCQIDADRCSLLNHFFPLTLICTWSISESIARKEVAYDEFENAKATVWWCIGNIMVRCRGVWRLSKLASKSDLNLFGFLQNSTAVFSKEEPSDSFQMLVWVTSGADQTNSGCAEQIVLSVLNLSAKSKMSSFSTNQTRFLGRQLSE